MALRSVIKQARELYDTVLIDTGPVPGSLEASAVAAAADAVVLVVSRGEQRPLAEKSIRHLHDIGASVAGLVFNRAEQRDMDLTATTGRLGSYERSVLPSRDGQAAERAEAPKLGPVALAVATRRPTGTSGNKPQS
jgi:Mrp family chromosome partitioning ATPase